MAARKPEPGQSFADLQPEMALDWHPTANGDLTPFDVLDRQLEELMSRGDSMPPLSKFRSVTQFALSTDVCSSNT